MSKLFAATLLFAAVACTTTDLSSTDRAILPSDCAVDADCPNGFECEVEEEHGVTTSFCQAHDSSTECPAGYELEIEHGQSYCKPHGGDDGNGGGSDDDNGDSTGTGMTGDTCASDADCAPGLECEIEIEHGQTTSFCKPHGG